MSKYSKGKKGSINKIVKSKYDAVSKSSKDKKSRNQDKIKDKSKDKSKDKNKDKYKDKGKKNKSKNKDKDKILKNSSK